MERAVDVKRDKGKLVVVLEPVGMERRPANAHEAQVRAVHMAKLWPFAML